jgi:hypothetical protein
MNKNSKLSELFGFKGIKVGLAKGVKLRNIAS